MALLWAYTHNGGLSSPRAGAALTRFRFGYMFVCMSRPVQPRTIEFVPRVVCFKPAGVPRVELEEVALTLDELEAVRLADLNGLYQERAAPKMGVSRSAYARILESARRKIADALVHGKCLRFAGGAVRVGAGRAGTCPRDCPCRRRGERRP